MVGEGYIKNRPFYIATEGDKLILSRSDIIDSKVQYREIKFNRKLIAGETYNITFKLTSVNSDESYSTTIPMIARQWSDIIRESGGILPEGFSDFVAFYHIQTSVDFEGYGRLYEVTFILCDDVTASSLSGSSPVLVDGIASYVLIDGGIPEGYEFTAEIDDEVEVVHKLDTKFINTSTEISENSTDNEVATAKSAYDLVQKAIQEALYVDKGDDV